MVSFRWREHSRGLRAVANSFDLSTCDGGNGDLPRRCLLHAAHSTPTNWSAGLNGLAALRLPLVLPPNLPTRDGLEFCSAGATCVWITFPVSLTAVDHMATFDLCRSMQRLWWLLGWYKSLRRSKNGDTVSVWRLWVSKGEQCIQCIQCIPFFLFFPVADLHLHQGGTNCQRLWRLWDKVQRVLPNKSCWVLSLLVYWSFSVSLCF